MEDEEYLLGEITLTEEDVLIEQVQIRELWYDADQKVLRLVLEENNTFDDLAVSSLYNISFERGRQFLKNSLPASVTAIHLCLLFKKRPHFGLSGQGQLILCGVLSHRIELLIQYVPLVVRVSY